MIYRRSLGSIAIALFVAACAGCATASSTSNPGTPATPGITATTPTSPSQPTAAAPASSSSTAVPSTPPRTYTFLGMTIALRDGWQSGTVVRAGTVAFNGVVTGGPCKSSSFWSDCPGFMALYDPHYQPGHPFLYGSGQNGCPQNHGLMQVFPSNSQPQTTPVSVGDRAAYLTQSKVLCISADSGGGSTSQYVQRLWWIPSAHVLVVDDGWMVSGLSGILKGATWAAKSPTTPVVANYTGSWHRHTDEFVINRAGYGTEVNGDGACPNNPTAMCGFVASLSYTPTADGLHGTYTSVLPTVNGVIDVTYHLNPTEPQPNDTFVLQADPHHRLQFTEVGRLTQFDGPNRQWLCNEYTPAQFNTCGA